MVLGTTDKTKNYQRAMKHVLQLGKLWLNDEGIFKCVVKSDKGKTYEGSTTLTISPRKILFLFQIH